MCRRRGCAMWKILQGSISCPRTTKTLSAPSLAALAARSDPTTNTSRPPFPKHSWSKVDIFICMTFLHTYISIIYLIYPHLSAFTHVKTAVPKALLKQSRQFRIYYILTYLYIYYILMFPYLCFPTYLPSHTSRLPFPRHSWSKVDIFMFLTLLHTYISLPFFIPIRQDRHSQSAAPER